ncbi:class I SAM-dependent methyltransferase [Nocardia sp. CA-084685]|uniref:class I SAM-dependent methyltransferase n=1 Tax=Nocardia sp. CA-084685 TaxID=3239970 RepID=UPI003D976BA0
MISLASNRSKSFGLLPLLTAAGIVGNGIRIRMRLRRLPVLEPSTEPVGPAHRFLTAAGVRLDDATRRAASAHAARRGLQVLDLIPDGLPAETILELLRRYNPATFRSDPFAPARSASHAILADADVLERAGIGQFEMLEPTELAGIALRLKQYAGTSTDAALVPGLSALPDHSNVQRAWIRAVTDQPASAAELLTTFAGPPLTFAALVFGCAMANPVCGALAVLAFGLQPLLTSAGSGSITADISVRGVIGRTWRRPKVWAGAVREQSAAARSELLEQIEERRPAYETELAAGTQRFFEARRETCPWCGAADLSVRLVTADLLQHKPGRFTLEECRSCRHVFQNPRLSLAGLEFYYRDFYDGLGGPVTEQGFSLTKGTYLDRARMALPFTTPKSWLDVGTGHGHFCTAAREVWPQTVFDGLDRADAIEEAERRHWIRRGYRGMFPGFADEMAGRYDVVSMFHYLEHTREPFIELDAAAAALTPGGHLLIELPNPESSFGRLLGRWWMPWLQPQHQHMIRPDNLIRALTDRGFTTVAVHRGEANQRGSDLTWGLVLAVNAITYDPKLPWLPQTRLRNSPMFRAAQLALLAAAFPVVLVAWIADSVCHQVVRHTGGGNAYRVLARKERGTGVA